MIKDPLLVLYAADHGCLKVIFKISLFFQTVIVTFFRLFVYLWSLFSGELSVKRVNFKQICILERQPISTWRFSSGPSLLIQIGSFFKGRVWEGVWGVWGLEDFMLTLPRQN